MSFTYNFENIATDSIAQVRFRAGITVDDGAMEDEVIQFLLTNNNGDVTKTYIEVLKNLVVQAAQEIDKDTGEVSESSSQRYKQLTALLKDAMIVNGIDAPVCIHFGGLDALEFELRNNDSSVYQGFVTENVSISPFSSNDGIETGCIGDEVIELNLSESTDKITQKFEILFNDWVIDGTDYIYTVTLDQHGTENPTVVAYDLEGNTKDSTIELNNDDITLRVLLSPDERFEGFVEVS